MDKQDVQAHQKTFAQPVKPHLISMCPTMDLVAAVTAPNQLEVFRFDGQRAFGWKRGSAPLQITALSWSDDGASISLAWSDGQLEIVDAVQGKVSSKTSLSPPSSRPGGLPNRGQGDDSNKRNVNFLGSGRILLGVHNMPVPVTAKRTSSRRHQREGAQVQSRQDAQPSLEDFTARILDRRLLDPKAEAEDLPLQLAHIDVEAELLQLGPLPQIEDHLVPGLDADHFSTQELVDSHLPLSGEIPGRASSVGVELATDDAGLLTYFINHDFYAGSHDIETNRSVIGHASHPFFSSHALLALNSTSKKEKDSNKSSLAVQIIDFEAVRQSGHFLQLVYRKTLVLRELSHYVTQSVLCLRAAWSACQDLPQRWIQNGLEAIQEQNQMELVPALYRLAVMGDCVSGLKEWLTGDIGERNHKRWDTAVTTNYVKIADLVQRNLLPALDRAALIASRLRSLARTPDIAVFAIDPRYLTRVMHDTDVLRLIANRVLLFARLEVRQFQVFSAWLGIQVVLQATEPESPTAQELGERAAAIDIASLLQYITGALTRSRLNYFLARRSADVVDSSRRPQQQIRDTALLVQILDRHADKLLQPAKQAAGSGSGGGVVEIVDMLYQALFLRDSALEVFAAVPQGLQKGTILRPLRHIGGASAVVEGVWDIRIVHSPIPSDGFHVLVLYATDGGSLTIEHFPLASSDAAPVKTRQSQFRVVPKSAAKPAIHAARFLDDDELVVVYAVQSKGKGGLQVARLRYSGADAVVAGPADQLPKPVLLHELPLSSSLPEQQGPAVASLSVGRDRARTRVAVLEAGGRRCDVFAFTSA